jgi:hypothetical protein
MWIQSSWAGGGRQRGDEFPDERLPHGGTIRDVHVALPTDDQVPARDDIGIGQTVTVRVILILRISGKRMLSKSSRSKSVAQRVRLPIEMWFSDVLPGEVLGGALV